MAGAVKALTRDNFVICIDKSKGASEGTYEWVRVKKSTTSELQFNATEETVGYIDSANDTTNVKGYAPAMDQETLIMPGDPCYDFIHEYMMSFPTYNDAIIPVMYAYPGESDQIKAYVWDEAAVVPSSTNAVDGKDTFSLKLNGDYKTGTMTKGDGDVYTFSPDVA